VCSTDEVADFAQTRKYKGVFGDSDGETLGFTGELVGSVNPKTRAARNVFTMRHSGVTGLAATSTTVEDDWTVSFPFPDPEPTASDYNPCDVFIIRRDKDFNLFLHSRDGDIVSFIPSKTRLNTPGSSNTTSGLTDGNLLIEQIGAHNQIASGTFSGYVPRFGVIDSDIGLNASVKLAKDLFTLYNP
jgi:hypothetical protein